MSKAVREAIATIKVAVSEMASIVKSEYPVGADIIWNRCTRQSYGKVIQQGYDGRLKVHNTMTSREYWINAEEII